MSLTVPPRVILALESSCDDTAVAVVEEGRRVLASVILSQTDVHARFGGVVPEAAARAHIVSVNDALRQALDQANLTLDEIDAFAATLGPGLIGSLLVGANTGKTLSLITGKPFLGVHHLQAHVASNYLESDLAPPFLCLLVSGGHTQLIRVEDYDRMTLMGETLDDAAGEAYDKIARLMALPYPGGPVLDRLAAEGNPQAFRLPKAVTKRPYDFSFSGLKTAASRMYEQALRETLASPGEDADPGSSNVADARAVLCRDMAAAFQQCVVETLFIKTIRCARDFDIRTVAIAGGVSANRGLRARFSAWAEETPDVRLYFPKMSYCTDNAAMVAACAYFNPLTHDIRQEVFSRGFSPAP